MGNLHGERGLQGVGQAFEPDAGQCQAGKPDLPSWRRWVAPALTSAALSALFLVVYTSTNFLSSLRDDVGAWYYQWEIDHIPFVPAMVIPYMSIDLFFVAAPFLCKDAATRWTLAKRITLGILIAGICFVAYPLKLGYVKPEMDGINGMIFRAFLDLDQPYNLLPSLHITLRTILAAHFAAHSAGLTRVGLHAWFSLIGFSTVLTYQHHVVDIAGGLVLAVVCFYLIPDRTEQASATRNPRIALYYGTAIAALVGLAWLAWPWGGVLLWPATSLGIATAGYCGLGARIFRKSAGVLPLATRVLLAPLLFGQYLSLVYYRRQCRAWDEVAPNVLIGRILSETEAEDAVRQGVTAVLDLTGEFTEAFAFRVLTYRNLPVLDLTAPTPEQLREAVEFIRRESAKGRVYVHCKIGYSRSAAVVGAYLLASKQAATADEAIAMLRRARPSIVIRPEARAAIHAHRV